MTGKVPSPDEFEGCAENASVVRFRSSRLSSGCVLRLAEAKKRLLCALSIVPVAEISKAQLLLLIRGRVLWLPEARKRLLRALSIVPLAVLSKAQPLPKATRDRLLAPDSTTSASSVCLSACIFAEIFSTLSYKEKLC
ncbi:unnamed protein product [Coccothraustes coccothraustes]